MRRAAVGVLAGTLAFSGAAIGVGVSPANALEGFEFERLQGQNRYGTAAAIARDGFQSANTVVLASGETRNFPDALTGNYLAGEVQGPILLTDTQFLPRETADALRDLAVQRVIIVGETDAVSAEVQAQVDAIVPTVERIGGIDRYETAEEVALRVGGTDAGNVGTDPQGRRTAVLGNGQAFPDILAAGPLGFAENFPITITPSFRQTLHPDTRNVLTSLDVERVIIVGGTDAVNQGVENEVRALVGADNVTRLGGTGRFETAELIANFAWDQLDFDESHVNMARSDDFADALAGGPHGGLDRAPIIITLPDRLVIAAERVLRARACTLVDGHIFGGPVAISLQTEAQAEAVARDTSNCAPGEQPPGEATALSLTPETAVNPVGTDHSVTATLRDAEGNASVDGELVRFEVYDEDGGRVEEAAVVESDNGSAQFTYNDNGDGTANEDIIVSCVVADRTTSCTEDTDGDNVDEAVVDPATGEVRNINQDPSDTARKSFEERVVTTLSLTPEQDTNVIGDTHTVTATVTDQFGDPVEGEEVLFELFRNVDEANAEDDDPGFVRVVGGTGTDNTGNPDSTGDDADAGEATFGYTYTGPEATDLIVACIDSDGDGCAELVVVTDGPDTVAVDEDDEFNDTATKRWVEVEATIASLTPADAINPVGELHTVTATVVDQFGDNVEGQEVVFEVFQRNEQGEFSRLDPAGTATPPGGTDTTTTNDQGTATTSDDTTEAQFEFTSADPGDFVIVACIDEDANGCAEVTLNGGLVVDEGDETATAEKTFVELVGDEAGENVPAGNYEGEVINFSPESGTDPTEPDRGTTAGFVDVFDGENFVRLFYESDDRFRVEGTAVNETTFELELAENEDENVLIEVAYNPSPDADAVSTFNITDDRDPATT